MVSAALEVNLSVLDEGLVTGITVAIVNASFAFGNALVSAHHD